MRKLPILMGLCLTVVLWSGCSSSGDDFNYENILKVGDPVPSFGPIPGYLDSSPIAPLSGVDFTGKKGLIVFFSTTCGDCKRELPKIEQVWQLLKDRDDVLIAPIARAQNSTDVSGYWSGSNFTMPFYLDLDKSVYNKFAEAGIPRLYTIDENGVITRIRVVNIPEDAAGIIRLMGL